MCSTPTEIDSSLGAEAESSSGNILEETIAHAFLAQSKMKDVFQEAFTNALGQFMKNPSEASNKVNLCWRNIKKVSKFEGIYSAAHGLCTHLCHINH